jgi:hypothetical protein
LLPATLVAGHWSPDVVLYGISHGTHPSPEKFVFICEIRGFPHPLHNLPQMAYAIPSSGMLTICLVLSGCDPATPIATVIERVEDYQQAQQCYFGVSDSDFRMALLWLAILRDEVDTLDPEQIAARLNNIPLREWVQPMLGYSRVYFNDEGESWDKEEEEGDYGRQLRQFFAQPTNMNPPAIAAFFAAHGIDDRSLMRWTCGAQDVI